MPNSSASRQWKVAYIDASQLTYYETFQNTLQSFHCHTETKISSPSPTSFRSLDLREALADDLGVLSDAKVGDGLIVQRQRVRSGLAGAESATRSCFAWSGERGPGVEMRADEGQAVAY